MAVSLCVTKYMVGAVQQSILGRVGNDVNGFDASRLCNEQSCTLYSSKHHMNPTMEHSGFQVGILGHCFILRHFIINYGMFQIFLQISVILGCDKIFGNSPIG